MNATSNISVVVPCLNEAESLSKTLKRLKKIADEILVVDNGSTDQSRKLAQNLGVKVLHETRKQNGIGYGFALRLGFQKAKGGYVVTIDADGEHPIEKIPQAVRFAQKNSHDFVNCARAETYPNSIQTKFRKLGITLLNLEAALLYGYLTRDILSGMWVLNQKAVQELNLQEGGWNLSPEIKLQAITNTKISYGEFPIISTVRLNGQSKQILWKTALQHAWFIAKHRVTLKPAGKLIKQLSLRPETGKNILTRLNSLL